jgi:hypothetical protein
MGYEGLASLWPLLVALVISTAVYKIHLFHTIKPIPPGDILVWFESVLGILLKLLSELSHFTKHNYTALQHYFEARINAIQKMLFSKIGQLESSLRHWEVAMLFILFIIAISGYLGSLN